MTSRRISVVTFLCAAFTLSAAVRVTSTTAQQPKPKADEFATLQRSTIRLTRHVAEVLPDVSLGGREAG